MQTTKNDSGRSVSRILTALGVAGLTSALAACSAGSSGPGDGEGDDGGTATGTTTGTTTGGLGGGLDPGGGTGGGSTGPNGKEYCQDADVNFVPKTPTVYVLVDRSSSMFEGSAPYWPTLKAGVLPVVEQLQGDVRFGFGSYTGSASACTGLTEGAPIAENNYAAIQAAYDALAAPSEKGETPTPTAIAQAREVLLADDSPGDRFILLVSDGNPDFCDDGGPECGADAVVYELQKSYEQGIRTLVFGITNNYVDEALFNYFAQAGFGEQPNWSLGLAVDMYSGQIDSACTGRPGWNTLKTASGKGEFDPLGTYSAEGGTQMAFLEADPAALSQQILASVEGLKSCIFDLGDNGVEVKAGSESSGEIFVNEMLIPADQWKMNSPTVLELMGDACTTWQSPEVTKFFAGFPCDALVIR